MREFLIFHFYYIWVNTSDMALADPSGMLLLQITDSWYIYKTEQTQTVETVNNQNSSLKGRI